MIFLSTAACSASGRDKVQMKKRISTCCISHSMLANTSALRYQNEAQVGCQRCSSSNGKYRWPEGGSYLYKLRTRSSTSPSNCETKFPCSHSSSSESNTAGIGWTRCSCQSKNGVWEDCSVYSADPTLNLKTEISMQGMPTTWFISNLCRTLLRSSYPPSSLFQHENLLSKSTRWWNHLLHSVRKISEPSTLPIEFLKLFNGPS